MAFSGGNLFAGILIVTILGARADHLGTHRSTSQRATMIERERRKKRIRGSGGTLQKQTLSRGSQMHQMSLVLSC